MTTNDMPDIGTIFYTSWGYDQTNVDFYKVTAVGTTMVTLRKIGKRAVADCNGYSDLMAPVPDFYFDVPFRRKVHIHPGVRDEKYRMSVRIASYASAWLYDGTPKRQTAMGWGH